MAASSYKDLQTSRSISYHYLAVTPQQDRPYLLFLHGFPSTSYDWRFQIAYFKEKGYGLIVPDMLGYGGTSKPTEVEAYRPSLICKDIIEVLDAEGVQQCIVIGHDWGCKITSRLADLYENRFIGFAFFAVGYVPPRPNFNIEEALALTKQLVGYELFGYWKFFSESDAAGIIEKNWESFFSIVFPEDPSLWKTHLAPSGALRAWLEAGKTTPVASWLSEEERKIQTDSLLKGGLIAPTFWYKVMTTGDNNEDEKAIAIRSPAISKPLFFGAATKDDVCVAALNKHAVLQASKDVTIREFDASHWVILEKKDEVNQELGSWFEDVIAKSKQ